MEKGFADLYLEGRTKGRPGFCSRCRFNLQLVHNHGPGMNLSWDPARFCTTTAALSLPPLHPSSPLLDTVPHTGQDSHSHSHLKRRWHAGEVPSTYVMAILARRRLLIVFLNNLDIFNNSSNRCSHPSPFALLSSHIPSAGMAARSSSFPLIIYIP